MQCTIAAYQGAIRCKTHVCMKLHSMNGKMKKEKNIYEGASAENHCMKIGIQCCMMESTFEVGQIVQYIYIVFASIMHLS